MTDQRLFVVIAACLGAVLLAPPAAQGRDQRKAVKSRSIATLAAAVRSSPYSPPTKDVFVADSGPGLDTGCVFNDEPANPLTVEILIDKFVGDVDGDGFLVDPAPLIGAGIIPATIDVAMPAFDVDSSAPPPPERDQVLFNGQSLGFLSGADEVWKLNTFKVDIRQVKFPARPAAGSMPTPARNILQVRIDTLNAGWCTGLDWVALVIPIRPKLALELSVASGNRILTAEGGSPIEVIYRQTFDAACNVQTPIGPADQYPFSGPAQSRTGGSQGRATLRAKIKTCPESSIDPPEVKAEFIVDGTAVAGVQAWRGFEGDLEVLMPPKIGVYSVGFKFTLNDDSNLTASRKLFVTKYSPLATVDPPARAWYEKAISWASGATAETEILSKVLGGLYGFGGANWRYGYSFSTTRKCGWKQLVADPIACNYSDCYEFSKVFENMAATLGVDGGTAFVVKGTSGAGFLTTKAASLDPAFPGNAAPLRGTSFDRYTFSSHSLRQKGGVFYDATFNATYGSSTAFIAANLDGSSGSDSDGGYLTTKEGTKIYPRPGKAYDSWSRYEYSLAAGSLRTTPLQAAVAGGPVSFTGLPRFRTIDQNGDGIAEALAVDIDVEIVQAGAYLAVGTLKKGTQVITARPANDSMQFSAAEFSGGPGVQTITLQFSGEAIFRSGQNGPYDLEVLVNSATSFAARQVFQTPSYDYRSFGEIPIRINGIHEEPIDAGNDGIFEGIKVIVDLQILVPGTYSLHGTLSADGSTVAVSDAVAVLDPTIHQMALVFDGVAILRTGKDGPYEGNITVLDEQFRETIDSAGFTTRRYFAETFGAAFSPGGTFSATGMDLSGNGLFDLLHVEFGVLTQRPGPVLVTGILYGSVDGATVGAETLVGSPANGFPIALNFPGPAISGKQLDGPYRVEVAFLDATTREQLDAFVLPEPTPAYTHSDFDTSMSPGSISLRGATDIVVDFDGNGLADQLVVTVFVQVAAAGVYEYSGRLVDKRGTEIGFYSQGAQLVGGQNAIALTFDGKRIATNGKDGPFFVTNLLMFGPNDANLVATDVSTTQPYPATGFEGSQAGVPGDFNADGKVDAADLLIFQQAYGSTVGESRYIPQADFDGDGRITANDLRTMRSLLGRGASR